MATELNAASRKRIAEAFIALPDERDAFIWHVFAHPVLLRPDIDDQLLRIVSDAAGSPEGPAREAGLDRLRAFRAYVAADPTIYEIGPGPIEGIWLQLLNGEIPLERALVLVGHASIAEGLSVPQIEALSRQAREHALTGGLLATSLDFLRVLVGAIEPMEPELDRLRLRTIAVETFIDVATVSLIHVPDKRILDEARQLGDALVDELLAAGGEQVAGGDGAADDGTGRIDDPPVTALWAATILRNLSVLHLDPYSAVRTSATFAQDHERWWYAGAEAHRHGGIPVDPELWQMPEPTEALRTADAYARRSLEIGGPDGKTSKILVQIFRWLTQWGEQVDSADAVAQAHAALDGLDAERHPADRLFVLNALAALGEAINPALVDAVLAPSLDELLRRHSQDDLVQIVLQAIGLLADVDPRRALDLIVRVRPLLQGFSEHYRSVFLDLSRVQLNRIYGQRVTDERPDGGVQGRQAELLRAAEEEHWDVADLAVALLCLATYSTNWDEEDDGLLALDLAESLAPMLMAQHEELTLMTRARLEVGLAVNGVDRRDYPAALTHYARAIDIYDELALDSEVGECLRRIDDLAAEAGADAARLVAQTLAQSLLAIERRLGDHGTAAVAGICRRLFTSLAGPSIDADLYLFLLQVAKGFRLSTALAGGLNPAPVEEQTVILLDQLAELGDSAPISGGELLVEEAHLASPHQSALLPGRTPSERVVNLQREFDERCEARTLGRVARPEPVQLSLSELQRALDPRTVLVELYVGARPDGRASISTLLVTSDEVAFGGSLMAEAAGMAVEIGTPPDAATVTPEGFLVADLRTGLQEQDPGDTPALDNSLADTRAMGDLVFGALWEQLASWRAAGRDHLCVVPHGPLHFLPYALLGRQGTDAWCLADDWTVTVLPSLQLLLSRRGLPAFRAGAALPVAAVGLGFAGGGPDGLPPIPEAVSEATRIGAMFGVAPLLDTEATKANVVAALQASRYAHIGTHGVHRRRAPAFQALYLSGPTSDDELYAFELLDLDLSGLEMVTLSACESSLARFDAGDNLRGLAPSLFLAGVSTVVGALWRVDSRVSELFFTTFYEALLADATGVSRLDAFGAAQRAARRAYPAYRDWGAFQLAGAWY